MQERVTLNQVLEVERGRGRREEEGRRLEEVTQHLRDSLNKERGARRRLEEEAELDTVGRLVVRQLQQDLQVEGGHMYRTLLIMKLS